MTMLAALPLRVDTDALRAGSPYSVLTLAEQYGLTTHDAAYLELCLRASLSLGTLDQELAHAARAAGVGLALSA